MQSDLQSSSSKINSSDKLSVENGEHRNAQAKDEILDENLHINKQPSLSEQVNKSSEEIIESGSSGESNRNQQTMNASSSSQKDDSSDNDDGGNTSEISDLSDLSQEGWQPDSGPMNWVQDQMRLGKSPRKILEDLVPSGTSIPEDLNPLMLWKIIINIVSEPPSRDKLENVNTLDDVMKLLDSCKKIVVLTGAGVSVSCGIPDFRSRDGVYARLAKDFPNLPDPQAMFDIHFFRNDPRPFYKFAKEIYPGQFKPSRCHHFIKLLEEKGSLLRNYTQNIDTLEQEAGIKRVVQCHGSFAAATCTICGLKVDSDAIKQDILNQVIPRCPRCTPSKTSAVMKPDIVFFGESLPEEFHNQITLDKDECDLLIVIGSSLKVRPVALIPNALPAHVPQILINRERLDYLTFDVELLGNCDDIVSDLCRRLGSTWDQLAPPGPPLTQVLLSDLPTPSDSPTTVDKICLLGQMDALPSSSGGDTDAVHKDVDPKASTSSDTLGCIDSQTDSASSDIRPCKSQTASSAGQSSSKVSPQSGLSPSQSTNEALCHSSMLSSVSQNNRGPEDKSQNSCTENDVMKTLPCEPYVECSLNISPSKSKESSRKRPFSKIGDARSKDTYTKEQNLTNSKEIRLTPHDSSECSKNSADALSVSTNLENKESSSKSNSIIPGLNPEKTTNEGSKAEVNSSSTVPQPDGAASSSPVDESHQPCKSPQSHVDKEGNDGEEEISLDSDELMRMWQSKRRISLAPRLSDDQVLFVPPSRYVFRGAEVFLDEMDDDEHQGTNSSGSSENGDDSGVMEDLPATAGTESETVTLSEGKVNTVDSVIEIAAAAETDPTLLSNKDTEPV